MGTDGTDGSMDPTALTGKGLKINPKYRPVRGVMKWLALTGRRLTH